MSKHSVFEILPIPNNVKPIGGDWVFVRKPGIGTGPTRFKARYIARGNSQLSGLNFHETFAPTATFTSLRILLTVASRSNLIAATFDFTAAYLNAYINKEVWIRPPDGLAGRCWWNHLKASLATRGFRPSNYNSSVYISNVTGMVVWLHVDNGIVFAQRQRDIDNLKCSLCAKFDIKWHDRMNYIVGINVNQADDGFHLSQPLLIQFIISEYWDGQHVANAPFPPKHNLVGTRPDIAFGVNLLARHSKYPGKDHWFFLQHLLGYLDGSITQKLSLIPNRDDLNLKIYSDASWGGEFSRSAHGHLTQLSGFTGSWCSKRLVTVASSSCHAELMALGIAARHSQWMQNSLQEISGKTMVINLKCNNASCMRIVSNCISNKRTCHSDREFFITNQLFHNGLATLVWVFSEEMLANVLTKALGPQLHSTFAKQPLNVEIRSRTDLTESFSEKKLSLFNPCDKITVILSRE
ncbi:hypothetical protein O181_013582 [Austropuccinia psidii MF-1]|uniref:Reverse transcriptase Ty1/copia-type domain-containing protein n=1 Tax=Austropuccinia psidii MF-1 TaxID=1389203 RepID=A0A9Q3BZY3_9BASI|nr:hypothetical protein [Austropuccinia psidii MF-1]